MGLLYNAIVYPHSVDFTPRISQSDRFTHEKLRDIPTDMLKEYLKVKIAQELLKNRQREKENEEREGFKMSVDEFIKTKLANKPIK